MTTGADRGLSRRALFGAGLARVRDRYAEDGPAPPARPCGPSGLGEADETQIAGELQGVADLLLERAGLVAAAPRRVLVLAAGDGTPLTKGAAALGHSVTAVEADATLLARGRSGLPHVEWCEGRSTSAPVPGGAFDAVLGWFGATYEREPRALAGALRRVVRPAGTIGLVAWSGAALARLGAAGDVRRHRPEQWTRFETAYRHFFDLDDLDVEAAVVRARAGGEAVDLEYAVVTATAAS